MAEPSPEFAAAVEAAGLLQDEYPDQMANASCTCEPEAVCGAHRLLTRYQQMYDRLVTVHAERREAKAEVRVLSDTATRQAHLLRELAKELRAAGDVQQLELSDEGVTQDVITLADELWLIALALDGELSNPATDQTEDGT